MEATCSRLIILRRGALAAEGKVQDLLARGGSAARYVVEAQGSGVAEALAGLPGVTTHAAEALDGRTRVSLDASGDSELRPEIFALARDRGWTLWELHRERANLEQLFRDLTSDPVVEAAADTPVLEEVAS